MNKEDIPRVFLCYIGNSNFLYTKRVKDSDGNIESDFSDGYITNAQNYYILPRKKEDGTWKIMFTVDLLCMGSKYFKRRVVNINENYSINC